MFWTTIKEVSLDNKNGIRVVCIIESDIAGRE